MDNSGNPQPAASFSFNSMQDIRSHSSILYNERMAWLFYRLDMKSIDMNSSMQIGDMLAVRAIMKQIYYNIRMLIRFNPVMRVTMGLDTKEEGIYVPDLAIGTIDRMIEYCEKNGYTLKHLYIIIEQLNDCQMMLRDMLQYFNYFIRPNFPQKPDVNVAVEKYKDIADKATVDELKKLVGKRSKIDFENLGNRRIVIEPAKQLEDGSGGSDTDYVDGYNKAVDDNNYDLESSGYE